MKKVILPIAIAFMFSPLLNATNNANFNELAREYNCWDVADATLEAFQNANLQLHHIATYEDEFNVWAASYDACNGH